MLRHRFERFKTIRRTNKFGPRAFPWLIRFFYFFFPRLLPLPYFFFLFFSTRFIDPQSKRISLPLPPSRSSSSKFVGRVTARLLAIIP